MYNEVLEKLKKHVEFRERKNRSRFLSILALRSCGLENKVKDEIPFTFENLTDFAMKFESFRRAWCSVLQDDKSLRGKDYDYKEILEQEKQLELGYSPGYWESKKNLKKLL